MKAKDVLFETSRLFIRKCSEQDVFALQAILGDPEIMRYSLKGPLDQAGVLEYLKHRILAHYEEYGYGLWGLVLKETNEFIGLAGLMHQVIDGVSSVEVGYRLARKYWGQGFATEAVNAIKEYAFTTLNIERLISIIAPENVRSSKVAQRMGMVRSKSTTFHGVNVDIYDIQPIVLCSFRPEWKELYEEEIQKLDQVFGKFSIAFHHIGSTSIPGCDAKPIIDILGITNDVLQIDGFNEAMEAIEYIALGEYGMKQRRFFRKRNSSKVNLHIFEDSDPEVARHLRFRDYLAHHPEEVKKYSALKKRFASKNSADIVQYLLGKEDFIKRIDYKAAMQDSGTYWNKVILPRKLNWMREEIIHAMEANRQLQMTYFAKYVPEMKIVFEPDVTVVMSTIPERTFNFVVGASFDEKNVSTRVAHVLSLFKKKALPFSWWIRETDQSGSLKNELESQGLLHQEEIIGMSLFLDDTAFSRKIEELSIQRVLEVGAVQDFVKGGNLAPLFSKVPPVLYGEGAPYEMYVGYIDKMPVVRGMLVLHANVGGIYHITIHPEYRDKEIAAEMIIFLFLRAKEKGYHLAVLQTAAGDVSVYQSLGFQQTCRFIEYSYP